MSGFTLQLHRPPIDHPHGLHGAFDAALYAMSHNGVTLDRDAAMVASGLAFRAYQFRASDNWAWLDDHPGAHWRWASLMVENYGAFEALAAHSKRDLCWYNDLKPAEWLGLVTYELDAGRVPVVQTPDDDVQMHEGDRRPTKVWALHAAARDIKSWSNDAAASAAEAAATIAFPALDEHPAEGALRVAGMLVARPAAEETPDSRLPALWRDALVFAVRHAQGTRELEFGQELYYASGAQAWNATAELLEQHPGDAHLPAFWARWATQMADARGAAARMLPHWLDHTKTPLDGDVAQLPHAAEAFQATSALMASIAADPVDAPATLAALREAATHDKRAFEALAKAIG